MRNVSTGLKTLSLALGICAIAAMSHATQAATTYTWVGNTDANITTAANWTPTLTTPAIDDTLAFGVAGSAGTFLSYDRVNQALLLQFDSGASAYTFSGATTVALSGTGTITNNSSSTQTFNSVISTGNGALNATSGSLLFNNNVAWGASGTLTVRGGAGEVTFASTAGGSVLTVNTTGYLNISSSTTINSTASNGGVINIGTGGSNGTLDIESGGSMTVNGTTNATKQNSIFGSSGGDGVVNINGGSLTFGANTGLLIGNSTNSDGVLNIGSGTVIIHAGTYTNSSDKDFSAVMMGKDATSASGTINLNGGTLETSRYFITGRGNTSNTNVGKGYVNFNGGTFKALADQTDWLRSSGTYALTAVTVKTGGAIVDSNGFNVAINNVLAHDINVTTDGGLTKKGAGTLTLGGASTYNGATKVDAGTLALGASGSINASAEVEIAAGAVFETVLQSSFAMAGAQPFTFAINGAGAGSAGFLNAAGLDISSGAVDFTTLGTIDDAAYIIASYTSLTGTSFASVSNLPSGYSIDYNYLGGNDIALVIPQPASMALLALGGLMMLPRRRGV